MSATSQPIASRSTATPRRAAPAPRAESGAIAQVLVDLRLQHRLTLAGHAAQGRIALLVGRRVGRHAEVVAAVFPPRREPGDGDGALDSHWHSLLATTLVRLEVAPALDVVGWMQSERQEGSPPLAGDQPLVRSQSRHDPRVVTLLAWPSAPGEPIAAFAGPGGARIPLAFQRLSGMPEEVLARLAALRLALPEFDELLVPDWVALTQAAQLRALRVFQVRTLETDRALHERVEALSGRLDERETAIAATEADPRSSSLRRELEFLEHGLAWLERRLTALEVGPPEAEKSAARPLGVRRLSRTAPPADAHQRVLRRQS